MATFSAKYIAELLFSKFWLLIDVGNTCPGACFTKEELELILLYVKHPDNQEDMYLTEVEKALANNDYEE